MQMTTTDQKAIADRVAAQRGFFDSGATLDLGFRREMLQRLRDAIVSAESELFSALQQDLGKSQFEAYTSEVGFVYEEIRFALRNLARWARPRRVPTPIVHAPASSRIYMRPWGVSAILGPWNYPFQLLVAPLVAAISAGNCALLKPSEYAPATGEAVQRLIAAAFEPAFVDCVLGDADLATSLTNAPVDHIFFTGSTRVGRLVARAAADRLIPATLELGGKSPAFVTQSARLPVAARRIAWGKILNAGQTCVAPDYVMVHRSQAEPFVEAVQAALHDFFPSGAQSSPDYGRIVNVQHFDRLARLADRQGAHGKARIGGGLDREQLFFEPRLFFPVSWSDPLMEEELFGPILPVIPYDDLDEAVSAVRARPAPLAAYLFSTDKLEKRAFRERVPAGGMVINDTVVHLANPHLPFGGAGASGLGSYHGEAGFRAFSQETSLMERGLIDIPLKYPPYGRALGLVRKIMRP